MGCEILPGVNAEISDTGAAYDGGLFICKRCGMRSNNPRSDLLTEKTEVRKIHFERIHIRRQCGANGMHESRPWVEQIYGICMQSLRVRLEDSRWPRISVASPSSSWFLGTSGKISTTVMERQRVSHRGFWVTWCGWWFRCTHSKGWREWTKLRGGWNNRSDDSEWEEQQGCGYREEYRVWRARIIGGGRLGCRTMM